VPLSRVYIVSTILVMFFACNGRAQFVGSSADRPSDAALPSWFVQSGHLEITFSKDALARFAWSVVAHKTDSEDTVDADDTVFRFPVDSSSRLSLSLGEDNQVPSITGRLETRGAIVVDTGGDRLVLGHFVLHQMDGQNWELVSTLGRTADEALALPLDHSGVTFRPDREELRLTGTIVLSDDMAKLMGNLEASGENLGSVESVIQLGVRATSSDREEDDKLTADGSRVSAPVTAGSGIGPDVIVGDISSVRRWARIGDITAYSISTTSCNVGDEWLHWFANNNRHPVIAQHMYRLKDSRFEQIGMSWVKHGFFATNGTLCSGVVSCDFDPNGEHLGVDCSDTYSTTLNGFQGNLGPRFQINPTTGAFPYPYGAPSVTQAIDRRLQVHDDDLDPALNVDALCFVEAQYITSDDAAAGNQDNNASYRYVDITEPSDNVYNVQMDFRERTQRTKPAILAWQDYDEGVQVEYIDVPGDRRFILGSKVSQLAEDSWHYEYAIQNLNSYRAGRGFRVPIPPGVRIENEGFHDVDSHSGSPLNSEDWPHSLGNGWLTWATEPVDVNPFANALRWGQIYNFRFDANTPPEPGEAILGLFLPGDPDTMSVPVPVPSRPPTLTVSDPPHGAIDARQPYDPTAREVLFGWQEILLTFSDDPGSLAIGDITVSVVPDDVAAPGILGVAPEPEGYLVTLDGTIPTGHWTCVSVTGLVGRTCLGYLPGDANGDGLSSTGDILALIDSLNGVTGRVLPAYASDMDRSGVPSTEDILRLIDLLNGAASFEIWLARTLPALPAAIPES